MIFRHDMVPLIRDGRKVQTRRAVRVVREATGKLERACRFRVGGAYQVQSTREWTIARLAEHRRAMEAQGPSRARAVTAYLTRPLDAPAFRGRALSTGIMITVIAVRQELLGEISKQDARREGFQFTAQFLQRWEELHGTVDLEQPVWVITFGRGDLSDRFDRPSLLTPIGHIGRIEYEVDSSGRQHWPAGDDHSEDYTDRPDQAMRGEPEAVSRSELAGLSIASHQRWVRGQADRAQELSERSATERLRAIQDGTVVPTDS